MIEKSSHYSHARDDGKDIADGDDGDGDQGILWVGGSQRGRRSDTSLREAAWTVHCTQFSCHTLYIFISFYSTPVAYRSSSANWEVMIEASLWLAGNHLRLIFRRRFCFFLHTFGWIKIISPGGSLPSMGRLQQPPWERKGWNIFITPFTQHKSVGIMGKLY